MTAQMLQGPRQFGACGEPGLWAWQCCGWGCKAMSPIVRYVQYRSLDLYACRHLLRVGPGDTLVGIMVVGVGAWPRTDWRILPQPSDLGHLVETRDPCR
jgi:hypothetical protein